MALLSDLLLQKTGKTPHPSSRVADALNRAGVPRSPELERILALPRRALDLGKVEDLTPAFVRPGGTMTLWPIQSAALWEAEQANGLFGAIGVGHGKTLISLLLPVVLQSTKTVLLVPPQLRDQLLGRDIPELSKHFTLPPVSVVAYSELSSARSADVLERLVPDLIVADEAHNLRHKDSARTKRFLRYMKEHPGCRFVALSGTMTTRSIKDYAHLIELALRKNSPLPGSYRELEDWASAIDVSDDPMPPGALLRLCAAGEDLRAGYRSRLVQTPGVVATEEGAIGTSLVLSARVPEGEILRSLKKHHGFSAHPTKMVQTSGSGFLLPISDLPVNVLQALEKLRREWAIGDEELEDGMALARVARQLACGFYYRWEWPGGQPDREWLDARSAWHREMRGYLSHSSRPGMDSPMLLARAAASGLWKAEHWEAWAAVKDRPVPPTVPVWLSDFLARDAVTWAEEGGIIWYEHDALGRKIAEIGNLPIFGGGDDLALVSCTAPAIVCSIKAHGTGKNLQAWSKNLITTPPAGGTVWEQLLGRTHRPGQGADEVTVDVYLHTPELEKALENALESARYIEQTQGQRQKILYASRGLGW